MRSYNFIFDSEMVECHNILWSPAFEGIEVFHREMIVFVPPKFETWSIIGDAFNSCLIQKIIYFLLVDL